MATLANVDKLSAKKIKPFAKALDAPFALSASPRNCFRLFCKTVNALDIVPTSFTC